jgi:hypothetical protein
MRFLSKPREIEIFGDVIQLPQGWTAASESSGGQRWPAAVLHADTQTVTRNNHCGGVL